MLGTVVLGTVGLAGGLAACASTGSHGAGSHSTGSHLAGSHGASSSATASAPDYSIVTLTPDQINAKAEADFMAARSVRMRGTIETGGVMLRLDLWMGRTACASTEQVSGKGTMHITRVGRSMWLTADSLFFRTFSHLNAAQASLLTGKYFRVPPASAVYSDLSRLCNPQSFAQQQSDKPHRLVKGVQTTIDGQQALELHDLTDGSSAYMSLSAKPELLRSVGPSGQGSVDFSDYNVPAPVSAPPASKVINLPANGSGAPAFTIPQVV